MTLIQEVNAKRYCEALALNPNAIVTGWFNRVPVRLPRWQFYVSAKLDIEYS